MRFLHGLDFTVAVNSTSRASTKSAEFEGQGFNWISIRTQVDPAVLGFSEPVQLHNRSVLLQHRVDVDTQRKVLQNSPRLLLTLNHLAPFSVSAVYGISPLLSMHLLSHARVEN